MIKHFTIICITLLLANNLSAQLGTTKEVFTRQDTLRVSITKERAGWDVKFYHLDIEVNPKDSTISGSNTIKYTVLKEYQIMQIDLQVPMHIDKVTQDGKSLKYNR